MKFLVHMQLHLPSGLTEAEQADLYKREAEAARPFFDSGEFERVWREPGTRNHWALWDVDDVQAIHDAYIAFPMFPWMTIAMHPLCVNVNDPGYPAQERPDVQMNYPFLRTLLDQAKNAGTNGAMENGLELCPGVSIHDHPGTDRARQIHFMVDGQKLAELGPYSDEGEGIAPGYVDFLARWMGRPVRHTKWEMRLRMDNQLLHPDYASALAAKRARF
jgi:muconolactone D-isomerase